MGSPLWLVVVFAPALAVAAYLVTRLVFGLIARSGLGVLTRRYASKAACTGQSLQKQTVQIGGVRWARCVTVCSCPAGLFIKVQPFLVRFPMVQIPWLHLKAEGQTAAADAQEVMVVPPQIRLTVSREAWAQMESYLKRSAAPS